MKSGLAAHLEDYTFFSRLIDLYEASLESKYLKHADELTKMTIELFEDKKDGGFFLTAEDGEKILIRPKEIYDGAIPSEICDGTESCRLSKITGNIDYEKNYFAFSSLRDFSNRIQREQSSAPCPDLF